MKVRRQAVRVGVDVVLTGLDDKIAGAVAAPAMRVQLNEFLPAPSVRLDREITVRAIFLARKEPKAAGHTAGGAGAQAALLALVCNGAFNCWRRLPARSATMRSRSATGAGTSAPLRANCE